MNTDVKFIMVLLLGPGLLMGCRLIDNPEFTEGSESGTSSATLSAGITGNDPTASSMSSSDTTTAMSECGNGVIDGANECDGADLGNATCLTEGFSGGTLVCSGECTLDTSGCFVCGDGVANEGEECDGRDLRGETCTTQGYSGGNLACVGCQLDASGCVPDMVEIPGGVFTMGTNEFLENAGPERQVHVDTFWIDVTEVTVDEYAQCTMELGACLLPGIGPNCNWDSGNGERPINCVTWDQAVAYCSWAGGRLPTEAEWEKAARGTDARMYPWGDSPRPSCEYAVVEVVENDMGVDGCGTNATMDVGTRPLDVSFYGARDMTGNVAEWVADWYAEGYDPEDIDNPTGPGMGAEHIGRGGAYTVPAVYADLWTYFRRASPVLIYGSSGMGFRCVQDSP